MGRDLAVTRPSFSRSLSSSYHCSSASCKIEMANVNQIPQMIPLITCEIPFGYDVYELVFCVDVFDFDFGVQMNSIEQPIKSNSVSSRRVSL